MPAYKAPIRNYSGPAKVDFTSTPYSAVKRDTDEGIIVCPAGERAAGFLVEGVASGETAEFTGYGVAYCVLGATLTAGVEVEVGASGRVIALNTGISVGILESGGDAGDVAGIMIK